jgi:hypothetical protein
MYTTYGSEVKEHVLLLCHDETMHPLSPRGMSMLNSHLRGGLML